VGMVRVFNDSSRLGFSTTDGRGNIIMNHILNLSLILFIVN
jgi:cold shock CspA family protein